MRALEFHCGIGGLHLALKRSKANASVVQAFDWDQNACQVYSLNYGQDIVSRVDISTLKPHYLASFGAEIWLLSPACQPYTVLNSNRKGASDPRAQSFLYLIQDVLPQMKVTNTHPSYLLVENVAGFETSSTRELLCSTLRSLDYATLEILLTPLQFGIPNSRLRYYLLAKRRPFRFAHADDIQGKVWRTIPGQCGDDNNANKFELHSETSTSLVREIKNYLEHDLDDSHLYGVPDKVLKKWGTLFDIVLPSSKRTCCFTRGYTHLVERAGSIIQTNEDLDTTEVFNKFLAAQRAGSGHAVQILRPLGLRYFTPLELLRLFDFERFSCDNDEVFKWPVTITLKTKYRLIGNSVNIRVVTELLNYMLD
ncbi:S-adenosyl-L-methionine-dependent methyltransferase [Amanita muscaria]